MNVEGSVRMADADDLDAIGAVQAAAWRTAYADLLPGDVLAGMTAEALAEQWRSAVADPPSPRHRVLVACTTSDVVGFVALGPAQDEDLDPAVDAELHALVVDPSALRKGHGSRLLQSAMDVSRSDGFDWAHTWIATTDDALRAFLEGAGWGVDGATRSLDLRGDGEVIVDQLRLHTALHEAA